MTTVAHIVYLVSSASAGTGGDVPDVSLSNTKHSGIISDTDVTFPVAIPTQNFSILYNGMDWTDYTKISSLVIRFPFTLSVDDTVMMNVESIA